jgi:hypothetical protein
LSSAASASSRVLHAGAAAGLRATNAAQVFGTSASPFGIGARGETTTSMAAGSAKDSSRYGGLADVGLSCFTSAVGSDVFSVDVVFVGCSVAFTAVFGPDVGVPAPLVHPVNAARRKIGNNLRMGPRESSFLLRSVCSRRQQHRCFCSREVGLRRAANSCPRSMSKCW